MFTVKLYDWIYDTVEFIEAKTVRSQRLPSGIELKLELVNGDLLFYRLVSAADQIAPSMIPDANHRNSDIRHKAIIENSAGKTTEIIDF